MPNVAARPSSIKCCRSFTMAFDHRLSYETNSIFLCRNQVPPPHKDSQLSLSPSTSNFSFFWAAVALHWPASISGRPQDLNKTVQDSQKRSIKNHRSTVLFNPLFLDPSSCHTFFVFFSFLPSWLDGLTLSSCAIHMHTYGVWCV